MTWYGVARDWADANAGALYAAPATPFDESGAPCPDHAEQYFRSLTEHGADGLAIGAHTGRGPHLDAAARSELVTAAARTGARVVAGVTTEQVEWAAMARVAGATALLVFPDGSGPDEVTQRLDRLWSASSLPLIGFDLYTTPYHDQAFEALLAHPAVAAIKVARLDNAIACQERIWQIRDAGKLAVTGEDRMFGPSLLWGAQAALVGIAAAAIELTRDVLEAASRADLPRFTSVSARLDEFASATFTPPYDGYVQRMMWVAAEEGILPAELSHDPYRPALPSGERDRVIASYRMLRAQLPQHARLS